MKETWIARLGDIHSELTKFLALPCSQVEVAKCNFLLQHWLKTRSIFNPVFPIPPCLSEIKNYKIDFLKEFYNYFQKIDGAMPRFSDIDPFEGSVTDKDQSAWRVLFLRIANCNTKLVEHFPMTMKAINSVKERVPTIIFSVMEPFKHIPVHTGFYCGTLRYHLGLAVPPEAFITIDDKKYTWESELCFDDTFPHSVSNPSDKYRVILLLDIVRDLEDEAMNKLNLALLEKAAGTELVKRDIARANQFHESVM